MANMTANTIPKATAALNIQDSKFTDDGTTPAYNGVKLLTSDGTAAITSGKTITVSNTITFTAIDGSTIDIGAGGTLGTGAFATIASYMAKSVYDPQDAGRISGPNNAATGGTLNLDGGTGGGGSDGGSIDLSGSSGGAGIPGGSIDTHAGGGSINTRGTGSIQLGVASTRTTLNGSASTARTISLPDASGTVLLTDGNGSSLTGITAAQVGAAASGTGLATDSGWTGNADAGDKTAVIPDAATLSTIATALDLVVAGAGAALLATAAKCKALETALVARFVPNA